MPGRLDKYLIDLHRKARKFELININGEIDNSLIGRYFRRGVCFFISLLAVILLKEGFSDSFVSYASSVLAILIGLFITAIIFSFDRFHNNLVKELNDYSIKLRHGEEIDKIKNYEVSVREIIEPNAKQKLWDVQSHNYSKQFAYITGWNIVLCIFSLILLSFSSLFSSLMSINIYEYKLKLTDIDKDAILNFLLVLAVIIQRFFVIYWITTVLYNTLFVISSLVIFMTVKIDRTND